MSGTACPVPQLAARGLKLVFPGGASIGAMTSQLYTSEAEIARSLLGQVQLVLAPMKPLFDLLAAVLAIIDVLGAVASLNPVKIAKELKGAAKSFAALAQLLPQVAGPLMVAHVLDLIVMVLEGFRAELHAVGLREAEIAAMEAEILTGDDPMREVLACAMKLNQARVCAVDEAMSPLEPLFELLNIFLKMLGIASLAPPQAIGHDVKGGAEALGVLIEMIRKLRRGLPFKSLAVTPRC